MLDTQEYVEKHLHEALDDVRFSPIAVVENGLSIYEKALIYHYTKDGYRSINDELRNKKRGKRSRIITLLTQALQKLPDHSGFVYRSAFLNKEHISQYLQSRQTGKPIIESTFVSTSRSSIISRLMPRSNTRFQIISKTGKNIEEISYMGVYHRPNEEEVLFLPHTEFRVVGVTKSLSSLLINMEEI